MGDLLRATTRSRVLALFVLSAVCAACERFLPPAASIPRGVLAQALCHPSDSAAPTSIALVVLAYNRVPALSAALDSVARCATCADAFDAVFVSIDGGSTKVASILRRVGSGGRHAALVSGTWVCERGSVRVGTEATSSARAASSPVNADARTNIARHYACALDRVFARGFQYAVLLEDDMVVGSDFGALFASTRHLLRNAEKYSVLCVSAWNDNGMRHLVHPSVRHALFRTSFFPGLGWMLSRDLWLSELSEKWPDGVHANASTGWDHWLRLPAQMQGRDCIAPVVPRARNTGNTGANVRKQEFDAVLATLAFVDELDDELRDNRDACESAAVWVPDSKLEYLEPRQYMRHIQQEIDSATRIGSLVQLSELRTCRTLQNASMVDLASGTLSGRCTPTAETINSSPRSFLYIYKRERFVEDVADPLGIFPQPRSIYKGVQVIYFSEAPHITLYLADARVCPFLRPEEQLHPSPQAQLLAARRGESCDAACASIRKNCSASELEFANTCEQLERFFDCPSGCGLETGPDLPAAVEADAVELATRGQCLVTYGGYPDGRALTCSGSFRHTRRLCACV